MGLFPSKDGTVIYNTDNLSKDMSFKTKKSFFKMSKILRTLNYLRNCFINKYFQALPKDPVFSTGVFSTLGTLG